MTTIAYREGIMASDSQESDEECFQKSPIQKVFRVGKELIGTSGTTYGGDCFVEWRKGNITKERALDLLTDEDDFLCMVVNSSGKISLYSRSLSPRVISNHWWAVGSGSKAALGAMEMGADAVLAVQIACKYDLYSSGEIQIMRLKEPKRTTIKA